MSGITEKESAAGDYGLTAIDIMRARGASKKEIDNYRKRQVKKSMNGFNSGKE